MKALLIEWDPSTGKRAGNINPKDPNLRCSGWQNMDVTPAIELRLVEDGEIGRYNTTAPGVTVLLNKEEINSAIDDNFPSKVVIEDELVYTEQFKEKVRSKKIDIDKLPDDRTKRLKKLKEEYGIKGIKEIKPHKV